MGDRSSSSPSDTDPRARGSARSIHRLEEGTIRQIAAGEVVERPSSVVKELIENALDAGATEVQVRISGGGLGLIEVADNGQGIPIGDFPLVFERHATSKLRDAAELPSVSTLGFRGEALASIAAVAHVHLLSRCEGTTNAFEMEVEPGSSFAAPRPAARARGTTLAVRDLFFNTPARRKFLRSAATESLKIADVLEQLYLASPGVALVLSSDGRELARYPRTDSLAEAAVHAFGNEFVENSFRFSGSGGPGTWIEGVASQPALHRGNSSRIQFAVNGRAFVSRPLMEVLRSAYLDLIPKGRYPLALVHFTVEGDGVDVNVHPSKREVRFRWEEELRSSLRSAVVSGMGGARRSSVPLPREPPMRGTLGPSPPRVEPARQSRLFEGEEPPVSAKAPATVDGGAPTTSSLLILGQVGALYVVAEPTDGRGVLVLVDAHAASERIIYERLLKSSPEGVQELLSPVPLQLTARQAEVLAGAESELNAMGFRIASFGGRTYRVSGVPSLLHHRTDPRRLLGVLDEIDQGEGLKARTELHDRVVKTVACHMAIRAGDILSLPEMERLLAELYVTKNNFTCPHGRPIMVTLRRDDLDKWFHRPTPRSRTPAMKR